MRVFMYINVLCPACLGSELIIMDLSETFVESVFHYYN